MKSIYIDRKDISQSVSLDSPEFVQISTFWLLFSSSLILMLWVSVPQRIPKYVRKYVDKSSRFRPKTWRLVENSTILNAESLAHTKVQLDESSNPLKLTCRVNKSNLLSCIIQVILSKISDYLDLSRLKLRSSALSDPERIDFTRSFSKFAYLSSSLRPEAADRSVLYLILDPQDISSRHYELTLASESRFPEWDCQSP